MSPEEHLKRMRDDEVWTLEAPRRAPVRETGPLRGAVGGRGQLWTTAVVAAVVVAVAGVAVTAGPGSGAAPAGPGAGAPATAPSASPAGPVATPEPSAPAPSPSSTLVPADGRPVQVTPSAMPVAAEPSAAPQRATTHGDRSAMEFVAADRADVARGQRAVACLHAKGVTFVDLAPADDEGIRYLEFGGADNDQRSISLGLQYADGCIAAASAG